MSHLNIYHDSLKWSITQLKHRKNYPFFYRFQREHQTLGLTIKHKIETKLATMRVHVKYFLSLLTDFLLPVLEPGTVCLLKCDFRKHFLFLRDI